MKKFKPKSIKEIKAFFDAMEYRVANIPLKSVKPGTVIKALLDFRKGLK